MAVIKEKAMIRLAPGGLDFDDMVVRVNQIMDQMMQKSFFKFRPCDRWQPPINLYETAEAYYLCLDLAGVDGKLIDLKVDGRTLRVSGHRPAPAPEGVTQTRIHVMEIDHGPFYRAIQIPLEVDTDRIEARQRNGLMWVTMPKTK